MDNGQQYYEQVMREQEYMEWLDKYDEETILQREKELNENGQIQQ